MSAPRATVRLQLNSGFTLIDACEQVAYYADLGISHFYLSPITRAVPGSTHGYDVADPRLISPELGGEAAFFDLAQRLRVRRMGIILDIVPNHMATHAANPWWWDVLRLGPRSAYADWFDIDWHSSDPALKGKVLAPFLAQSYSDTLGKGALSLVFDDASQSFEILADGARYPLAPESLTLTGGSVGLTLAEHDCATAAGRLRLHALLERQHYVLGWWHTAADRINWRRFFEVSSLIGVRVERQAVFDAVHALPLWLFAQGLIDGVRIDHVDGLARPLAYCRQLSEQLKARTAQRPEELRNDTPWVIVEKILAEGEVLDERWAVHGTTGYDFMDQVGAVLHDSNGKDALTDHWNEISGAAIPASEWLVDARNLMLQRNFVAEYQSLLRALWKLLQSNLSTRDWTLPAIDRAMQPFLSVFPHYRTYLEEGGADARDVGLLMAVAKQACERAEHGADSDEMELIAVLIRCLGAPAAEEAHRGEEHEALRRAAINRFQQLTPPLAAKALEDTVFYRYGRLLSRNEVGSSLNEFALPAASFHQHNVWRHEHAPESMVTTATHDQKRGEDTRARLAVVSEIPDRWVTASRRWLNWEGIFDADGEAMDRMDRYMLIQAIVGAWPLDLTLGDNDGLARYAERIVQWQTKALREAKMSSSWLAPNLSHEERCADAARNLLVGTQADLRAEILQFIDRYLAPAGAVNSFTQLVLRMTVPGVPDLYQGMEFWDFTLVDPDNRRPVDFPARRQSLRSLLSQTDMEELIANWRNGHIKQAIIARILDLREQIPDVFAFGQYVALQLTGPASDRALAFLRADSGNAALVVVPHLCAHITGTGSCAGLPLIRPEFWRGTYVELPENLSLRSWSEALTGELVSSGKTQLPLEALLAHLPVAVLRGQRAG